MTKESVLERVINDTKTAITQTGLHPELNPFVEGNWFDIGKKAVHILTEKSDIVKFMEEYTLYINQNYKLPTETAKKEAEKAVGYCTGYTDDEQANKWFDALPDISHPITGRERPFKAGETAGAYYVIGKSNDIELRKFLTDKFMKEIPESGFTIEPVESRDNSEYFAFKVEIAKGKNSLVNTIGSTNAYMLLYGYVQGSGIYTQEQIGKTCPVTVEIIGRK